MSQVHHAFTSLAVLPLADKWGGRWKIPTSYVLAICEVESSFRPSVRNMSAVSQGGAWGLMQVTYTTAESLVRRIKHIADVPPLAVPVLVEKWRVDEPTCLLDPELNVMLGSFYLASFAVEFGYDIQKIAAAYHNGAGFLRGFLAATSGKKFPADLPEKAGIYVERARTSQRSFADEDRTPLPKGMTS